MSTRSTTPPIRLHPVTITGISRWTGIEETRHEWVQARTTTAALGTAKRLAESTWAREVTALRHERTGEEQTRLPPAWVAAACLAGTTLAALLFFTMAR